jgi:hypothetical protein
MLAPPTRFRYSENVFIDRARWRARVPVLLLGLSVLSACKSRTPDATFESVTRALQSDDAETLFETLDLDTRWSWMTIQRYQRESYDIVMSNYPQGTERETQLRRLEAGAVAQSAAELYAHSEGKGQLAALKKIWPQTATWTRKSDEASVLDREGKPLVFRLKEGRWGLTKFGEEADLLKKRAASDIEVIKTNATDFERAARRGQP